MNTNSSTTLLEWLNSSTSALKNADIETPRLDCLILMEDALGVNRANLLAYPEKKLDSDSLKELNKHLRLRMKHRPLAYIRSRVSFYGHDFFVDQRVLVPRPESESIIDELLALNLPKKVIIADIGTGSGVLGLTAALEISKSAVDLYDISPKALAVARQNAERYGLKPGIYKSDLLKSVGRTPDVVIANLPYVPINYPVNKATIYEPSLALYGGNDGLELYKKLWKQLSKTLGTEFVITEALPSQHLTQSKLAKAAGYRLIKTSGYVQVFKKESLN